MYIPLNKKIDIIEYKGCLKKCDTEELSESLHVFDKQNEMSEYISGFAVECLKANRNEITIDISKFGLCYKKAKIKINRNNLIPNITGTLKQVDDNGNIFIELSVYKYLSLFDYGEKQLFNEIKNIIQHELGHTHFIYNKYKNSGKIDQTSTKQLYQAIILYLQKCNVINDVYYLCYSIYSVYGNELNAFVSQCNSEVRNFMEQYAIVDNEGLKKAIINSNVYQNYNTLKNYLLEFKQYNINSKKSFLKRINDSLNYMFLANIDQLNNLLDFYVYRIDEALKMCKKTAMKSFYDFNDK